MLSVQERLGLNGDAVAGGGGGRDPGQQQRPVARGGRAVLGKVTMLHDEQRDGNPLRLAGARNRACWLWAVASMPSGCGRVHGQKRTSDQDKTQEAIGHGHRGP